MSEAERYFGTFDRRTGEPIGIVDTWKSPAFTPGFAAARTSSMPPQAIAALWLLGFVFAAGLFGGMLLFGHRGQDAPIVITCPAPGVQVAALPAECGAPGPQAVTR